MAGEIQFQQKNFPNPLAFSKWVLVFLLLPFTNALNAQTSYPVSACSGNAFNFFLPNTPATTTYTWPAPDIVPAGALTGATAASTPKTSVSDVLVNTTSSPATATYLVTTDTGGVFRVVVTVNPLPKLSSSKNPPAICSGNNFVYQPQSATQGASYQWSRVVVPGISNNGNQGSGNPNEILTNTTINPVKVIYSYAVTANGCTTYNEDVEVTVNPVPLLTSTQSPADICSGTPFNYTPTSSNANTFTWSRQAVFGISNPSANGSNGISEVLVNTTLNPIQVTYIYTLGNNTQACTASQLPVRLYVYPVPNVPATITVNSSCSGNTFMAVANNVPQATKYTWAAPTMVTSGPAITGGTAEANEQFFVGQALYNNGTTNETIRYQVKPIANGCAGNDFFVDVTVTPTANSTAVLDDSNPAAICSGSNFIYQAESNTAGSYAWRRFYSNDIVQSPSSSGASITGAVNEPLTNRTYAAVNAYYAFTLTTLNGCTNTQLVPVKVNPATALNTTLTPVAICSNTIFSYAPASHTGGTAFGWSRVAVANISNPASSGSGNPMETLVNTSNSPVTVEYTYALITGDGCTNTQNVRVVVNPTPRLTSPLNPNAICSESMFNYPHTSSVTGTSFSWSRGVVPEIANAPGSGSLTPSELLINTTPQAVNVMYAYTLVANGCANNETVTVNVKPTPRIFSQAISECSNRQAVLTLSASMPNNVPAGTAYTWTNPTVDPSSSLTGMTTQTVPAGTFSQTLRNQTLSAASAKYTVTPSAGTCTGLPFEVTISVHPEPNVGNQVLQPICSGTAFSYTPANVPSGTTYTWSFPVQIPFNSLTGGNAQPVSQSSISQVLSSSNNISDTAIYAVTPFVNGCTGNIFTLTVPVSPVPVVNNIIDTICTGEAFSILPANVPVNTTYQWGIPVSFPFGAVVGGTAQTSPSTSISQTLQNATTAPARAVYTITPSSGSCAGAAFEAAIVVGNALPVFANQTITICGSNSFNATPVIAPAGTVYTWGMPAVMPSGAIPGLNAQTTPVPVVAGNLKNNSNITDTVVYTINGHHTGCTSNTFTATVYVLPTPRVTTIAGNAVICRYPEDSIVLSFNGRGPWSFTYNDGATQRTVSGILSPTYNWRVPASAFGVSQRTLAITSVNDNFCSSIDTVYLTQAINPLPVAAIASRNGDYICNNTIATLYTVSQETLGRRWTYNGAPIVPALTTDSVRTLTPGSYNAIFTNTFGCTDTAAVPLLLRTIATPIVKFEYDSYCINRQIRFNNTSDTAGTGTVEWTWDFGDSTGANTFHGLHTYLKGGKHHVKLTAKQLFCPSNIITADSTLDIQYPLTPVRMPSVSAYKRQPTPLAAREIAGYRYEWVPGKGIDNPLVRTPDFNFETTQDYNIHLISPGGCITADSMLVRVFNENLVEIFIPKAFTPNNDGTNDVLLPYLSGIKTFHYFKVFNRFGKLLFETRNYDNGWNGSYNGVAQPMGIYIWVSAGIANDGTLVERRGQTLLIR